MDISRPELPDDSPSAVPGPGNGHRVRCIQPGLGSTSWRNPDSWSLGNDRGIEPHQLSRAATSLPCSPVFCKIETQHNHTATTGQRNGSDVHKQNGRDPLPIVM